MTSSSVTIFVGILARLKFMLLYISICLIGFNRLVLSLLLLAWYTTLISSFLSPIPTFIIVSPLGNSSSTNGSIQILFSIPCDKYRGSSWQVLAPTWTIPIGFTCSASLLKFTFITLLLLFAHYKAGYAVLMRCTIHSHHLQKQSHLDSVYATRL